MATALGTQLGTRLGTELQDFTEAQWKTITSIGSGMYALTGFSGTSYYGTQTGGGEEGTSAGFGVLVPFIPVGIGATQMLTGRYTYGTGLGFQIYITAAGVVTAGAGRADGTAYVNAPTRTLAASDFGKVHIALLYHDGAKVRLWLDRMQSADGTTTTGFSPSPLAHTIAYWPASQMSPVVLGEVTFRGLPTESQVLALSDRVRTLGDVPTKAAAEALMPGTTVTHRWSLRDALVAAGAAVTDGQVAPASIPDSVTLAPVDAMARTGLPIVRVIDPSVDGRKAYGALGFSATSVLQSAPGAGFRGNPTGFTVRVAVTFGSIAAGVEYFAGATNSSGTTGWCFARNAATLFAFVGDGAARSSTKTLTASDLNVPHLLHLVFDGSTVTQYFDGVALTPSAGGSYTLTLSSIPMTIGAAQTASLPAVNEAVFALGGANHVATAAEVAADFAAWQRTSRLANIPAKPDANRYELTLDVEANGGPQNGVPAQVLDRVGTDHLTRVGTGLQVAQRAERLWSYESTPILYGASGFTQANFYSSGVWNEPAAAAWWAAALFTVTSQSVASGNKSLLGNGELVVSTYTGFHLCAAGTNSLCYINLCNAAGTFVSGPVGSIAAADVGKLLLYVGVWDPGAGKIRGYWKRAEIGTGAVSATYLPSPATPLRMGRSISNADWSANNIVVHGVSGGFGLPTLAQVQALFDETMAIERIGSIAGMTNLRIDLTQDALGNGGVVPATLTDRAGSFNFARTGSINTAPHYARAWNW